MKIIIGSTLMALASIVSAECYTPKTARDAIRAIALVSDRSMITDLVGGLDDSGKYHTFNIWANYRNHGYSDHYKVVVEERTCRIISLSLLARDLPIKEGE